MTERGQIGWIVVFQVQPLQRDVIEYAINLLVILVQRHTDAHHSVRLRKQQPKSVPLEVLYAIMAFVGVINLRQKNGEMDHLKELVPRIRRVTLMAFAVVMFTN